jgi:opacity protein-like surface antigen
MKKVLLVMVLAAIVAGGAFALDMSAGGGAFYAGGFGGGAKGSFYEDGMHIDAKIEMPFNAFGVYGFFDATYVEVSASLLFGSGSLKYTYSFMGMSMSESGPDYSFTSLGFGLLGKYPFKINDKITLFPAVGIEYQAVLSLKADGETQDDAGDFSHLWFRFGGGLDYNLTDKLYLRGTLLYGIRTVSKIEKDMAEEGLSTNLGHGPALKVAIGYKF